ncbi:MAG: MarR family transcriptional regulator [Pseudomonadota bacterium]
MSSYRRFLSDLSSELKPIGLAPDACLVLLILNEQSSQTTTQLAERLGLNLPTATKLIDRLVSDNLAHRTPDLEDRRRIQVRLTRDGSAKVRAASAVFHSFIEEFSERSPQIADYVFPERLNGSV